MESYFKCKCYEIGYAKLLGKVTDFKKYLVLKKLFFWKGSSPEEVPASKKYMLWIITYSGETFPPKQLLCWKSIYLQEVVDQKKRLLPRSSLNLQPSSFANALSFSVFQNTSHRKTNFLSKQLYFQSSIDYIEMRPATSSRYVFVERFFSEYLVVWSS